MEIYQLKLVLRGISPMVWRRLLVHADTSLATWSTYGERYRNGETISSAFVESTVNRVISKRMVKKQSMQWTPWGAHLLLQTRTRVLNDELEGSFRFWYPQFRPITGKVA